jgi:hypothetical protein
MSGSIVLEVCRECKVHPAEFFGPGRDRRLSNARRLAIQKLKEAEFNNAAIARLMRRNYSTIQYWLHPEYRERRTGYYRNLRKHRRFIGAPPSPLFSTTSTCGDSQ